jgi:hypothetical protein
MNCKSKLTKANINCRIVVLFIILALVISLNKASAQHSVAHRWNEVQLSAIRQDLARPPVQARNLYHASLAMYEAWAIYDPIASNSLLGKTVGGTYYNYPVNIPILNNDIVASQEMALSYAAYRLLRHRYAISPFAPYALYRFDTLMNNLGYDKNIISTNYVGGTPAELGNYIAEQIISMGLADGSNEANNYINQYYTAENNFLNVSNGGNTTMQNMNRWQPLTVNTAADQNGNPVPSNQINLCPEWGNVLPFSLNTMDASIHIKFGQLYKVYFDNGGPTLLDTLNGSDSASMHYKWSYAMVALWSSFLTPDDTTLIDISPNAMGNKTSFPSTFQDQYTYYNYMNGGDNSTGHVTNPVTGLPYTPQLVKRGDYTRVVSQYWADGPNSETPPGHWFVVFNTISKHPALIRKIGGQGSMVSQLEWDVKGYFALGGAMHDAAISAWALKGWYDSPRPVSIIRKMASYGQSSDSTLPSYHPCGLPLIPGKIELITASDSMAIANPSLLNKIKLKAWRAFDAMSNPLTDYAGVGWILADNWMPYQRRNFVTPNFAGYVSGHSTYSRTAADLLTAFTGSAYFPGGIYETTIAANSNFLVLEKGPSMPITLQWATYADASNEASLSRMYGGIHPPTDDGHGRYIGTQIALTSFNKANQLFSSFALPIGAHHTLSIINDNCIVKAIVNIEPTAISTTKKLEVFRVTHDDEKTKIGTINSFDPTSKHYTIKDENPTNNSQYQLVQTSIENNIQILDIKHITKVNCGAENATLSIYPNPVTNNLLNISFPKCDAPSVKLFINNLLGQEVFTQLIYLHNSDEVHKIVLPQNMNGLLIGRLMFENGMIETFKFTKQ